jgi:hypothetical protein
MRKLLFLALLGVFATTYLGRTGGDAATSRRVVEHHADGSTCVRSQHQICTLFVLHVPTGSAPGVPPTPPPSIAQYSPVLIRQSYPDPKPRFTVVEPIPHPTPAPPTIMIVDYDHAPKADSDLAVFRSQFGLSPCRLATHCLTMWNVSGKQENQSDPATYPPPDPASPHGQQQTETMTDLDAASTLCPECRLALVELSVPDDNSAIFYAGVNVAKIIHPDVISLSYAIDEVFTINFNPELLALHIPIMASSGDEGYQPPGEAAFPAVSPVVTAVGELLTPAERVQFSQTTSGYGCSTLVAQPAFQRHIDFNGSIVCSHGRVTADISAQGVIDMYDSYCPGTTCGWSIGLGTSVSAPLVAGLYAHALQIVRTVSANERAAQCPQRIFMIRVPDDLYAQPKALFTNQGGFGHGATASANWYGPLGLGSAIGTAAFMKSPIAAFTQLQPAPCVAAGSRSP